VQTPASFEYERATSVEGAIEALQRRGSEARVIAGGHSLLPMMMLRVREPELHHRKQAVATGDDPRVRPSPLKRLDCALDAGRAFVLE